MHQFIARDLMQYAAITVRRLRQGIARLGELPTSGRVVPEFPAGPYREVLIGSYRIQGCKPDSRATGKINLSPFFCPKSVPFFLSLKHPEKTTIGYIDRGFDF